MSKICRGCGGVLGRDCWNEIDCMDISTKIAQHSEYNRFGFVLEDTKKEIAFLEDWKQSMLEESYFEI